MQEECCDQSNRYSSLYSLFTATGKILHQLKNNPCYYHNIFLCGPLSTLYGVAVSVLFDCAIGWPFKSGLSFPNWYDEGS
jgi:hypothetical protein